ncbi:MAG: DUF4278 domain-containing protein [Cyanobacteria bacterium P01_G01_bin.39]
MKLRFLGQTYSSQNNNLETIAAEHTARFLGQSYIPRRPISVATKPQLGSFKYRGVTY